MAQTQLIAGRFRQGKEIGVGGMGTVYLGMDTQTGEQVAIKVLKPDIVRDTPDLLERFEREGDALRRLNHPTIVKVLGTVEENGNHYIILEYVQGGSLRDYLEKTPQMPISQVLEIAIDLSDALGRAHRLNIVHRDIKPANVLLAEDGTPRLTDFGIAHIGDTSRMTQEGSIIGTMAYMPPEALAGKAVDVRGDIWSFGVMLYEMVTGRHPFVGESTAEMLFSIVKNDPPDILSLRDYEDFGSWGLPGLIYWMMEKDREKRPASARLVGAMVEHLMAGRELPQLNALSNYKGDTEDAELAPETAAELARSYTTAGFSVEKLNEQLANADIAASLRTTETVVEAQQVIQKERSQAQNRTAIVAVGVVIAIILLGAAGFAFLNSGNTNSAAFAVPRDCDAEPIAEGEFMILVAQPEYIDGDERDVQRFITDDLTEHLEQTIPNARYRVRNTETIVRDSDIAEQVAELCNAVVILWGNYDSQRVEITIQLGAEDAFPAPFIIPYDETRVIADGRYHLTNERQQTLAVGVIGSMNLAWASINEAYNLVEGLTITQLISDPQPEIVGSTASARYHQYIANYVNEPELAITFLDQAIVTNGGNALLYLGRALGYQRVSDIDAAQEDIDTARRLGPENWAMPDIMLANEAVYFQQDYESAVGLLDTYISTRPDAWFPYTYRGSVHYLLQNYDLARLDIEQALALNPVSNIPYASGVGLALRDADFVRTQALIQEAQRKFPNPSVLEQILSATFNEEAVSSPLTPFVSAFSNFSLGRWQAVINDANAIIETGVIHPDPYMLRGFAQCNLQDYESAEASYTEAINIAPDYTMLYFLRAEVRQRQGLGRALDALADLTVVTESEQATQFAPFTSLGVDITAQINCETIFDVDLTEFGFETGTEGTTGE